ncbi:phage head-tail connector protein [Sporolactobacillus sp. KGMB 08714]|uniref:phage head-tail connector protein n=1 Tax=Sporolactobacillus sp. KGMB 08714 TaxID=3064704 RepID=UPI002FBE87E0
MTALTDQVKALLGISDSSKDAYLNVFVPGTLQQVNDYCNQSFTEDDAPFAVVKFIAKSAELDMSDVRLKSRSMGNVSYSFNTELPDSVMSLLTPYRKVRFTCFPTH